MVRFPDHYTKFPKHVIGRTWHHSSTQWSLFSQFKAARKLFIFAVWSATTWVHTSFRRDREGDGVAVQTINLGVHLIYIDIDVFSMNFVCLSSQETKRKYYCLGKGAKSTTTTIARASISPKRETKEPGQQYNFTTE